MTFREVALSPTCGEPPIRLYDTSGPYADPTAAIDLAAGLRAKAAEFKQGGGALYLDPTTAGVTAS